MGHDLLPSTKVPCRRFSCDMLCSPSTKVPCRRFLCEILCPPSTKGAVSMKRGGGAFEFTVTPEYNPALDSAKEDLVVVGRIAPDAASSDFLEYLNTKVVVRKDILSSGADVPPLGYAGFARACDFSSPDKTCAQFKPIGRIVVAESSCESLAPVPVPGDAVVAD